jgi:hypothetical protein
MVWRSIERGIRVVSNSSSSHFLVQAVELLVLHREDTSRGLKDELIAYYRSSDEHSPLMYTSCTPFTRILTGCHRSNLEDLSGQGCSNCQRILLSLLHIVVVSNVEAAFETA